MNLWQVWKLWLVDATGLSDSTLHVLAGMLLLLGAAAVLRRVPWSWRPWNLVLGIEIANEVYDMINPASLEGGLRASLHDFWLTMLCPTLLVLLAGPLVRLSDKRARESADRFE